MTAMVGDTAKMPKLTLQQIAEKQLTYRKMDDAFIKTGRSNVFGADFNKNKLAREPVLPKTAKNHLSLNNIFRQRRRTERLFEDTFKLKHQQTLTWVYAQGMPPHTIPFSHHTRPLCIFRQLWDWQDTNKVQTGPWNAPFLETRSFSKLVLATNLVGWVDY